MDKSREKLTQSEWLIFIIIASAILGSFVISRVKVSVIKIKNTEIFTPGGALGKKDKKTIVFK